MDFLIVSDTHGRADRLEALLQRSRADILLFLGDGLRDLALVPDEFTLRAVRGNCDFFTLEDAPDERLEVFGELRILMMHGHRYHVKSGLGAALAAAADSEADVLLYGHTHRAEITHFAAGDLVGGRVLKKALIVMNPGSLGQPPDGKPTFGTLTVRQNGILPSIGEY